ncbi:PIG-L deacetylase family protein [Sabulicella glaciei]|uniref:PIG-L family deacetylase n=1 Tax=Sabulicella glaciei TaxID=2984948 RepID=A0ABT3NU51_9PROT|nr:PIG-L family deacetylase [Roseococcus sp. MDT2-1-1]
MIALALSPHLDDAAFSCGGTLARMAAAGWRVLVVTAFTASVPNPRGFALECQRDKGLPDDADYMALRRAEDLAACAALGAAALHLPFREAPHRGYADASALFAQVREDDAVHLALAPALSALPPADLWLMPQAIGGHVDHVQLLRAAALVRPLGLPLLHWEDWPYAARPHSHPARPVPLNHLPEMKVACNAAARRRACHSYVTQLGFQFGGPAELDAALDAAGEEERFRLDGVLPAAFFPSVRGKATSASRPSQAASRVDERGTR